MIASANSMSARKSRLAGIIVQDVITEPSRKWARIQGDQGFLEWHVNYQKDEDRIIYGRVGEAAEHLAFTKTRPDDFKGEIDHVDRLLDGADRRGRFAHAPPPGPGNNARYRRCAPFRRRPQICLHRLCQRLDGKSANALIGNFFIVLASIDFFPPLQRQWATTITFFVLLASNRLCLPWSQVRAPKLNIIAQLILGSIKESTTGDKDPLL